MSGSKRAAFSLLEILAALALFASVVMALLELWPRTQRLRMDAIQKTTAALIAQRIIETYKATLPHPILATAPDWKSIPSHQLALDLQQESTHYLGYDTAGMPQGTLSAVAASLPQSLLTEKKICSVATVQIKPSALPGLIEMRLQIATPASLPASQRHQQQFIFWSSSFFHENEK